MHFWSSKHHQEIENLKQLNGMPKADIAAVLSIWIALEKMLKIRVNQVQGESRFRNVIKKPNDEWKIYEQNANSTSALFKKKNRSFRFDWTND